MGFFQVSDGSGAQIHFEILEGLVPVDTLCIHGNMASTKWWGPAAQVWKQAPLSKNGALILVDFRGCGQSTPPRSQKDVAMDLFAEDFIALVRSLKRGPMNLIGHSTGGLIAALMLEKAPELFNKAVLLDPVGAGGIRFDDSLTGAFEQMKTNKELVAIVLGSTIYQNDPQSEFFKTVVVEDAFHAAKTVGDKVLRALDGLDVRSRLRTVKHPVLVLHGEHDQLLPMADSKELAALMSNSKFEVIQGQGHCANVENSEKFVKITSEFLFS